MQKPKLILGTANFAPTAYGQLANPLSLVDIRFILEYAKKHGITMLEGSELYGCDELLNDLNFELIYKVKHPYSLARVLERTRRNHLLGLLYHHDETSRCNEIHNDPRYMSYHGASVYSTAQLTGREEMVEVPLNIENKDFEKFTAPCKIIRSVFGRGELLKKYTIKECLDYIKSVRNIHGVIIGVDNVQQLEEVLREWNG